MKDVGFELSACKLPCNHLMFDVQLVKSEEIPSYTENWMEIMFLDTVVVETEINNYDFYRLLVEVLIVKAK